MKKTPQATVVPPHFSQNPSLSLPKSKTLSGSFLESATKHSEHTAIQDFQSRLTYAQLKEKAESLAQWLLHSGLQTEQRVAIYMEREPDAIIAMIATHLAGGAYVPMDPKYPADRVKMMLEDSGATYLLTHHRLLSNLPSGDIQVYCLDDGSPKIETSLAFPVQDPKQIAYLIFTSGSTGRPKGVSVTHQAVTSLNAWAAQSLSSKDIAGVFASTSICFDLSVFEIFTTLSLGGRVILGENAMDLDGHPLAQEVTLVNTVPSAMIELVNQKALPTSMRVAILCGEPFPKTLAPGIFANSKAQRVFNLYGPSEDTIYSTFALIPENPDFTPHIGQPIPDTEAFIVSPDLQLKQKGDEGELLLAGLGLARGYHNRPKETAIRFVPNPFSNDPGSRLYRTGDLCRVNLVDDHLYFLGRMDHQVKLRGFRIEMGEIENQLEQKQEINRALVTVQGEGSGKYLHAHLEVLPGQNINLDQIPNYLSGFLPEYMIPMEYMVLDRFPRTPNGKIDRKSLPSPNRQGSGSHTLNTDTEKALAPLWEYHLGVNELGRDDHFFRMGGHSITALRLCFSVQERFGKMLDLATFQTHPTIGDLARRLDQIQNEPSRLIPRDDSAPIVSPGQRQLWLLHQITPDLTAYSLAKAWRFSSINLEILSDAVRILINRQESLRTSFRYKNGTITPYLLDPGHYDLEIHDYTETLDSENQMNCHILEHISFFDLNGPLTRFHLYQLQKSVILAVHVHHAIFDGWSEDILIRELSLIYSALKSGYKPDLPTLEIQYTDFAHWQATQLCSKSWTEQREYWKQQLKNTPVLNFPIDHARPAKLIFEGQSVKTSLTRKASRGVQELAKKEGLTPYKVMLACWSLLIARYSDQYEFTIATPVAGRRHHNIQHLIGYFVNTLIHRTDLRGNPDFRQHLQRVSDTVDETLANQDLPLEEIVKAVNPARDPSRNTLYDVMFLYTPTQPKYNLGESQAEPYKLPIKSTLVDLTLAVQEGPQFELELEYNPLLFEPQTIQVMSLHFKNLLDSCLYHPDQNILVKPYLSEHELAWQRDWNETTTQGSMLDGFEKLVIAKPDSIAVDDGSSKLTYHQLHEEASQIAYMLLHEGITREMRAAIYLDRDVNMIAAMLGVLMAGGAYLPLDPSYPPDRIRLMLESGEARWILTHTQRFNELKSISTPKLFVDQMEQVSPRKLPQIHRSQLAYLIFTSGSTGRPKPVAITHQSAVSLIDWSRNQYVPDDLSGVFAATSICFDLSVFEIFVTLNMGGRILLADNALSLPTHPLAHEVSLINSVPSAVSELISHGPLPDQTRVVNLAGEAFSSELITQIYVKSKVKDVFNLYGPSEDTTYSTHALMPQNPDFKPSIGRPLPNTYAFVVDPKMRAKPVGLPGELTLGGSGLARGYLNRPAETANSFIPNPFSKTPGSRLYRTGDLVRLNRNDANLYFQGRIDHQIKLRGFRIELGEIESVLTDFEAVDQALATLYKAPLGDQLVAYISPAISDQKDSIFSWIKQRLPAYMIPTHLVFLDGFPLTANGKINRKALPNPALTTPTEKEKPREGMEQLLAGIWSHFLKVQFIGRHENFFSLGGNSLLMMRIGFAIEEAVGQSPDHAAFLATPTIAGLAQYLSDSPRKSSVQIKTSNRDKGVASFGQARMYLLQKVNPKSAAYNMAFAWQIDRTIDSEILDRSFRLILQRHQTLRTTLKEINGDILQIINPPIHSPLTIHDVRGQSTTQVQSQLNQLAQSPFDLNGPSLFTPHLFQTSVHNNILMIMAHHSIFDGWSIDVLLKDLDKTYSAFEKGRTPSFPALSFQYVDFSIWQHDQQNVDAWVNQRNYWLDYLNDPPILNLPMDYSRPRHQSYEGEEVRVFVDPELCQKLRYLCSTRKLSVSKCMLTIFNILIGHYSGQKDFLIGVPVAGRNQMGMEHMIGFFVNTVIHRPCLSQNPDFISLCHSVSKDIDQALFHSDIPFDLVVDALKVERDLSRNALFDVMYVHIPEEPAKRIGNTRLEPNPVSQKSAYVDITFTVAERSENIQLTFEFNTALFKRETIERMAQHTLHLIRIFIDDPFQKVLSASLLQDSEKAYLIDHWNTQSQPEEGDRNMVTGFLLWAEAIPDQTAILFEDQSVSYQELLQQSQQIAHQLTISGLKPEEGVAIFTNRNPKMVAAMIAVHLAGGFYIPIDPNYPADRISLMLELGNASFILTQSHLNQFLPKSHSQTLFLDNSLDDSCDVYDGSMHSESLAYLIFTSGSTGKPKPVAIPHSAALALFDWASQWFQPGDFNGVFAATSICFDLSIFEIFATLNFGGRLILGDNATSYLGHPHANEITLINTVPSAMKELIEVANFHPSLRVVNLAGESFSQELIAAIYQKAKPNRVFNLYGPSEDTTYSTGALMKADNHRQPAIGRPITGSSGFIVNQNLQLNPIGIPGELVLGGAGMTRGYLNRPAETALRFIPNPFSANPGERLYRTGDLAKMNRDDEQLYFMGRLDHQVKIRGFRIELGEIQYLLESHQWIDQALVLVYEKNGFKQLISYVVGPIESQIAQIKSGLSKQIPEYMVPSLIIPLETFPLTSNGKIDRAALPNPQAKEAKASDPPISESEDEIAKIMASQLGLSYLGRNDNFFSMGGNSLSAMRVWFKIQKLGLTIDLADLLANPTPSKISSLTKPIQSTLNAIPVMPRGNSPIPASASQTNQYILQRINPESAAYNLPMAWTIQGKIDPQSLSRAIQLVVSHHEPLRTLFDEDQYGNVIQIIRKVDDFPDFLQISDYSQKPKEIQSVLEAIAEKPFNLQTGPLFFAYLFNLKDHQVFMINLHHIVFDGWSSRVFIDDLNTFYLFLSGQDISRPAPLPVQFADFVLWRAQKLDSPESANKLDFWKEYLSNAPILNMPLDHPRPEFQTFNGKTLNFPISNETAVMVRRHIQETGTTANKWFLAIFEIVLAHFSKQRDFLIGLPVAGRNHPDLERMIGFFTNTVIHRADLKGNPSFNKYLSMVSKTVDQAIGHEETPLVNIVDALKPERDFSRNALFSVMFLHIEEQKQEFAGFPLKPRPITTSTSHVDLSLMIHDGESGFSFSLEYNPDLFYDQRIQAIARHITRTIDHAARRPDESISALSRMDEGELKWLKGFEQKESDQDNHNPTNNDQPANPIEEKIYSMWESLFPGKTFSVNDPFFKIGGNSLIITRLARRFESTFKINVRMSQLFRNPTIRRQATYVITQMMQGE